MAGALVGGNNLRKPESSSEANGSRRTSATSAPAPGPAVRKESFAAVGIDLSTSRIPAGACSSEFTECVCLEVQHAPQPVAPGP